MAVEVQIARVVARGVRRGPYRKRSVAEKRAIVQECMVAGASVAAIALAHRVNANLVRKWIRKFRLGEFGQPDSGMTLLPVTVHEVAPSLANDRASPSAKDYIDIELAAGRVRVHGRVDVEALRTVLASLRG